MRRAYENWRTWIFSVGQGTNEDQTKGLVQTEGLESSPKWPRGLARVNAFQVIRSTWIFTDAWSVIRWSVSWPMAFGDLVTPDDLSMGTRLLGDQDAKCHSHKEKSRLLQCRSILRLRLKVQKHLEVQTSCGNKRAKGPTNFFDIGGRDEGMYAWKRRTSKIWPEGITGASLEMGFSHYPNFKQQTEVPRIVDVSGMKHETNDANNMFPDLPGLPRLWLRGTHLHQCLKQGKNKETFTTKYSWTKTLLKKRVENKNKKPWQPDNTQMFGP